MLDDDLRALTSLEPSPDFTARVRERIRADHPRRSLWPPAAIALAAVMVVVALVVSWPRLPGGRLPLRGVSTLSSAVLAHDVSPLAHSVEPRRPVVPSAQHTGNRAGAQRGDVARGSVPVAVLDPAELEALQELFESGVSVPLEPPRAPGGDIAIEPLFIEPLVVESIAGGAPQ